LLLTPTVDLGLRACILEEGENSIEFSPNTKLAVAENEKLEKSGQVGFPKWFPVVSGKPTSNCWRVTGTQGG